MASAIRSCFTSCLASESHFSRFITNQEGHYKIVKAADPIFDLIGEVAKAADATEATQAGIGYGRESAQVLRHVMSIFHIFTGVIPSLIYALKKIWELVKGLFTGQDVQLHPSKKQTELTYCEIAKGNSEKWLSLGIVTAKCMRGGSATFAFMTHPFVNSGTHQATMLAKHASGALGHCFEIGYHYVAFHRALVERESPDYTYQIFERKILELTLGLLEKGLQLLYDFAKMVEKVPPPWFRLPLTFTIVGLGLYKVWLKTE